MKARNLQFGKAMSAALFVLLLVVAGTKNTLAQNQVATLQHGNDVSAFYGANAFVLAHGEASGGDIITLSSGTFVPCEINKGITLRGAGCAVDTVANTNPTVFTGNVVLHVTDPDHSLTIEGILFSTQMTFKTLQSPKFNRCNFTTIAPVGSDYHMVDAQFVNCIINTFNFSSALNTVLINSVVWDPSNISTNNPAVIYNSIFGNSYSFTGLSAHNSIIIKRSTSYMPNNTCTFINCIGIKRNGSWNPLGSGYQSNCVFFDTYEDVFESFAGDFTLDEPFFLKDDIINTIHGGDGTQVGIYGGFLPYTNRPGYMVLKRCVVAPRSTTDGHLNVEIEVVTEGE